MTSTLATQTEWAYKESQGRPLLVKETGLKFTWVVYLIINYGNTF